MKSEFTGSTIEYVAYIIVGALITTITLGLRIYCSVLYDKTMGNRTYIYRRKTIKIYRRSIWIICKIYNLVVPYNNNFWNIFSSYTSKIKTMGNWTYSICIKYTNYNLWSKIHIDRKSICIFFHLLLYITSPHHYHNHNIINILPIPILILSFNVLF